jgi:hypothetical protein
MDIDAVVSKARIEVDDVFELLINDVDLKVERFFADNKARARSYHDQPDPLFAKINQWREACIVEIRACKDYNLSLIDTETAQLPLDQRLKQFCFLALFVDTVFNSANQFGYTLFSTDKFLTKGEIACFEALLKFMPGAEHDKTANPEMCENNKALYKKSIDELFVLDKETKKNIVSTSAL